MGRRYIALDADTALNNNLTFSTDLVTVHGLKLIFLILGTFPIMLRCSVSVKTAFLHIRVSDLIQHVRESTWYEKKTRIRRDH